MVEKFIILLRLANNDDKELRELEKLLFPLFRLLDNMEVCQHGEGARHEKRLLYVDKLYHLENVFVVKNPIEKQN